jgi:hypothetical protein
MNNMFFATFFIVFYTSILIYFAFFLGKMSFNSDVDSLISYSNKKKADEDSKKYIINVDPAFNAALHNRESAIEKMSQVQLILGKDKIYRRTILK